MTAQRCRFSMSGTMGFRTFEQVLEVAHALEELGFHSFYASDHLYGVAGMPAETPALEPWTLMAGVAAATKRLRLGVLVSGVTYRHPAMLAKVTATLDVISRGRLELGIGAAWSKDDHVAYGLAFPPLRERQERLEEAVEIIHGLFTQERFSFAGRHYQLRDAVFEPKPVQRPRPPFLIAAVSERSLDIAARRAHLWASVSTPAFAGQCVRRLRERAQAYGRDPGEILCGQYSALLLTDDREQVRRLIAERVQRMDVRERRPVFSQARSSIEGESAEERVRASLLVGNAAEVRAQIQRYVDAGVTHIILMTPRPFDRPMVERFRREVMSAFVD